jgi:hypothetical protein
MMMLILKAKGVQSMRKVATLSEQEALEAFYNWEEIVDNSPVVEVKPFYRTVNLDDILSLEEWHLLFEE